jgi:hypothetical protein
MGILERGDQRDCPAATDNLALMARNDAPESLRRTIALNRILDLRRLGIRIGGNAAHNPESSLFL